MLSGRGLHGSWAPDALAPDPLYADCALHAE